MSCLGVAATEDEAFVIPAGEDWQVEAIREVCESDVPKVLQNAQYDTFFLKYFNEIEIRNVVADTMLQWHSLQPELAGQKEEVSKRKKARRKTEKSLRFLASIFCRDSWFKDYDFASEMEKYELCGVDCMVTLEIAKRLKEMLR